MNEITLPTGSNRNKVEYLAKQMQAHGLTIAQINIAIYGDGTPENKGILAELENGGGSGGAPVLDIFNGVKNRNLLVNPDFSAPSRGLIWSTPNSTNQANYWVKNGSYMDHLTDELFITGGFSSQAPMLGGWGVEYGSQGPNTSTVFINAYEHHWSPTNDGGDSKFEKMTFPLEIYAMGGKRMILFSVFEAPTNAHRNPMEDCLSIKKENAHINSSSNTNRYSAYLLGRKESGKRFGIAELDRNGDFVKYIKTKEIDAANWNTIAEYWIHDIQLTEGNLYAFIIESDGGEINSADSSFKAFLSGVFLNNEMNDIPPPLGAQRYSSMTQLGYLGTFGGGNHTLTPPAYPAPFGKHKHYLFGGVERNIYNSEDLGQKGRSVKLVNNEFTLSGELLGPSAGDVHYFYSETPTHINFFTNGG